MYVAPRFFFLRRWSADPFSAVSRLLESQKKLEAEEDKAEKDLEELQSQLNAAVSRLLRIRKIKRKTKERRDELFRRGMQELDEEDGILSALDSHEQWVANDLSALGVSSEVDWSAFGLDLPGDPGLGTGVEVSGSSSNS